MYVDPVHQRPRDLSHIPLDLHRRTSALTIRAEIAAWTRIHGCNESNVGRKRQRRRSSRDRHSSILERLTQYLENAAVELRQFVQEQYAQVSEAHLARFRYRAASDQPGLTYRMVRRFERTPRHKPRSAGQPRDGMDPGDLERFFKFERRQDRRQTFGEHRLARTRRPDEKYVVPAGRRDLERLFCVCLAARQQNPIGPRHHGF